MLELHWRKTFTYRDTSMLHSALTAKTVLQDDRLQVARAGWWIYMGCRGSPLISVVSIVSAREQWKGCLQHPPDGMAKVLVKLSRTSSGLYEVVSMALCNN